MSTNWSPTDYFRRLAGVATKTPEPILAEVPKIIVPAPAETKIIMVEPLHPQFRSGITQGGGPLVACWASVYSNMTGYEVIQWGPTERQAKLKCLEVLRTYARKRNSAKIIKTNHDRAWLEMEKAAKKNDRKWKQAKGHIWTSEK